MDYKTVHTSFYTLVAFLYLAKIKSKAFTVNRCISRVSSTHNKNIIDLAAILASFK